MNRLHAPWLAGAIAVLTACGSTAGEPVQWSAHAREEAIATAYTARLPAHDPEHQAIAITQTVYAATREENVAGAIILAPQDPFIAYMAMHRMTHMPVNAPLLYLTREGRLGRATKSEMKRLHADGVVQDGKVQVYALGDVPPAAVEEIERDLKYKVRTLRAADPVAMAELLDRWQAALKSDHPDEVVISAIDHPDGIAHGIGAMGFNAHMGKGFAWVYRDSIPALTRRILERRLGGAYMYLTGPSDVISDRVATELARYGLVHRVAGPTVYASNAVNAGYKDFGRNFGYWWDIVARDWGWGISQAGHNFIVGSADDLLGVIPAAVLGHMGKHGPMLLVDRDSVPTSVAEYLEMVRPYPSGPRETVLNHAWIIGDTSRLSWGVQREITQLLSPRRDKISALAADEPGGHLQETAHGR